MKIITALFFVLHIVFSQNVCFNFGDVKTLTFHKNSLTTGIRSQPRSQLQCMSGACQYANKINAIQCTNNGANEYNLMQWMCNGNLPNGVDLGSVTVVCEGCTSSTDENKLKGSCSLMYELKTQQQPKYANLYYRIVADLYYGIVAVVWCMILVLVIFIYIIPYCIILTGTTIMASTTSTTSTTTTSSIPLMTTNYNSLSTTPPTSNPVVIAEQYPTYNDEYVNGVFVEEVNNNIANNNFVQGMAFNSLLHGGGHHHHQKKHHNNSFAQGMAFDSLLHHGERRGHNRNHLNNAFVRGIAFDSNSPHIGRIGGHNSTAFGDTFTV